jgi:hypothetical protein
MGVIRRELYQTVPIRLRVVEGRAGKNAGFPKAIWAVS